MSPRTPRYRQPGFHLRGCEPEKQVESAVQLPDVVLLVRVR